MLDIGSLEFLLKVPSLPREELQTYSMHLFDAWERYVQQHLSLPDYSLVLQVEEGSVKGRAMIATAIASMYLGIAQYGSFISGLQAIRSQVTQANTYLTEQAKTAFPEMRDSPIASRRKTGVIGKLERLFAKVQHGDMTVEDAMLEAERLLGDESASSPKFMHDLETSLREAPRTPIQLQLPMEELEEVSFAPEENKDGAPKPSEPRPRPVQPVILQLRVEVWRESKNGKRRVKITEL